MASLTGRLETPTRPAATVDASPGLITRSEMASSRARRLGAARRTLPPRRPPGGAGRVCVGDHVRVTKRWPGGCARIVTGPRLPHRRYGKGVIPSASSATAPATGLARRQLGQRVGCIHAVHAGALVGRLPADS
jgi:hypothetical protein